ncbi:MAG: DUF2520 domain-containing protein [Caldithrix sp.]|nr:DUF2520 domain-containing protein [Caldithrix sp.]
MSLKKHILIIGAGRVGTALFRVMAEKTPFECYLYEPYYHRDENTAPFIGKQQWLNKLSSSVLKKTRVVFIAVPDDQIKQVVAHLSHYPLSGSFIIHTSGSYDSSVLTGLKQKNAFIGSWHPVQSFSRRFLETDIWNKTFCSFEGDDEVWPFILEFCEMLNAYCKRVDMTQKQAIHVAAVATSNYLVGIYAWANEFLQQAGLDETTREHILFPLVQNTTENLKTSDVYEALTGPLKRGDSETVKRHLAYLRKLDDQSHVELYIRLASLIVNNKTFVIQNREELRKILRMDK